VKLHFLGTRGEIDARARRHRMHTSMMVSYKGTRVMIDCGEDWLGKFEALKPDAIVITHAHPDHAWGLQDGTDIPVYATDDSWQKVMNEYPIENRNTVVENSPFRLGEIQFNAFGVEHSTRAPAVGYRVTAGATSVFYVPDLVYIHDRSGALKGVRLYIGDGATIAKSMVRRRGDILIGHTPVRTQLTWCEKEGVPKMIVTHCGSEIVTGDERKLGAKMRRLASERGVEVQIAYDGMELILR
jgi:phosphoribosyl 1,2-cyclic phosphodiesterase